MTKKELEEIREALGESYHEDEVQIDFKRYLRLLWSKRKYYCIVLPLALVVALLLTMGVPKYYVVSVKLAPELSSMSSSGGGLNSIMRSLGFRSLSSSNADGDAILPNLYPELMNSQLFRVSLFDVPVESSNGSLKTTYYDYLAYHQQHAWWSWGKGEDREEVSQTVNATALTPQQTRIAKAIAQNVICDVDERTYVITISVKAQDPVICAAVADSTCHRLQQFITDYRMKKAKAEYDHMQEQFIISKQEYEEAMAAVASFNAGNWDIVSDHRAIEKQNLQNQMQLKFSAYSALNQQLLAARVKLDEARPVFTVLDGAVVPLSPAGPRRKGVLVGVLFLVFLLQSGWFILQEVRKEK